MAEIAEVIEILRREGPKGLSVIKCKLIEGDKKGKILGRVVVGRVECGDIIYLKETEMEFSEGLKRR
ncbi:MAG: 30S ribosomal protein S28e [Candidatus Aenigmarchaeota archaeon ex4484_56]|nr:MAG: 30S ribosomal protein S28e [Candidatus Aenigmarchaeota archaeon ex4484_56]